jgi:hypothetical protein
MTEKEVSLHLNVDQLNKLKKDLQAQTKHLQGKISNLERDIVINAMSYKVSEDEPKALEELSDATSKMKSTKAFLEPLKKRLAVIDALLDPDTIMWLTVQAGDCGKIVDKFLEEALGEPPTLTQVEDVPPETEVVAELTEVAEQATPPPSKKRARISDKTAKEMKALQDKLKNQTEKPKKPKKDKPEDDQKGTLKDKKFRELLEDL